MKILQAYVSPALRFFEEAFLEKYGLAPYTDNTKPAIFFGCYGKADLMRIIAHQAQAVLVWGGSDAIYLDRCLPAVRAPHIHHVAIGRFIENDLKAAGIPFRSVAVTPFRGSARPVIKGPCVYVYMPSGKGSFYGKELVDQLAGPWQVIRGEVGMFDREAMHDIYSKCFIGLRLTPHDGLPNTVAELGLRGIPCVYNGGTPGSLSWKTIDDINTWIDKKSKHIGTQNPLLAGEMELFLSHNQRDWLDTEFYKK